MYARVLDGNVVTVLANGTGRPADVDTSIYTEVLPKSEAYEVVSGERVEVGATVSLAPKQVMILDFTK